MEENKITYAQLKKDVDGLDCQEIYHLLFDKRGILFKTVENIKLFTTVDSVVSEILKLSKEIPSIYLSVKKQIIFFNFLKIFTNIEMVPEDEPMNEYNIDLEIAFKNYDSKCNMFWELVEDGLKIKEQEAINKMVNLLSTNIPSIEDIQKVKDEMDNLFKDESPERLKTINDILSFNDPTMLTIKEALNQAGIENARNKQLNKDN